MEKVMEKYRSTGRIIVTGPESTGKTELCRYLSGKLDGTGIPEYAREYIAGLKRKYTYRDVEHIAEIQRDAYNRVSTADLPVFFDTHLILTKVWFSHVFKRIPDWIDEEIGRTSHDLYLLCEPDIPWVADPLRENGGEMREVLFKRYETEIRQLGARYEKISGTGDKRIVNALRAVEEFLGL